MSFVIRNLDTGESFDARDESHVEIVVGGLSQPKILTTKQQRWKDFWEKVKELNEKLWDAGIVVIFKIIAEIGNVDVVLSLV